MPWTWVRPADPSVLEGRPLLDVGMGDGQTRRTLAPGAVGVDRSLGVLRAARRAGVSGLVAGEAERLPFGNATFAVALAADLFHHLDDLRFRAALGEIRRVLRPGGRMVAWWYAASGRDMPGGPRFPRPFEAGARAAREVGLCRIEEMPLEMTLEPAPATVGLIARKEA